MSKILGKEVTMEDGKQYMRTDNLFVDFNLGKSRFRIKDYLNDGNILGKMESLLRTRSSDPLETRNTARPLTNSTELVSSRNPKVQNRASSHLSLGLHICYSPVI